MTTEIEAKLREIEACVPPECHSDCLCTPCMNKRKLVQALRRALVFVAAVHDSDTYLASCHTVNFDIEAILSAPNDKEENEPESISSK